MYQGVEENLGKMYAEDLKKIIVEQRKHVTMLRAKWLIAL